VNHIPSKRAFVALSLLSLTFACKEKEETEAPKKAVSSAAAATSVALPPPPPAATTAAQVVPDAPVPAAGSGLAKAELDGKEPDAGWMGASLSVSKLTFLHPKDWSAKTGDFSAATTADRSNGIAAGKYPDGASGASLRDAAAKALGLSECSWGASDTISLGKDKLSAEAADGTCKRDGKAAKALFVATSGKDMNVLAVGSWDDGKDNKAVLNTLRSAKGAGGGGGDATGIAACCAAIKQNMASAPIMYQGAYAAALGACSAAMSNPQGKQALGAVRGMLGAAGVPAACK
jgi:hypothetical protein